MKNNGYYDAKELLETPAVFKIALSGRATGKSTSFLYYLAKRAIEDPNKKFLYLNMGALDTPVGQIRPKIFQGVNKITDLNIMTTGNHFVNMNDGFKPKEDQQDFPFQHTKIGLYMNLEKATDFKSLDFSDIKTIFIDEFNDRSKKYPNVLNDIASLVSTVSRNRMVGEGVDLVIAGNQPDTKNILVSQFNLTPQEIKKNLNQGIFYTGNTATHNNRKIHAIAWDIFDNRKYHGLRNIETDKTQAEFMAEILGQNINTIEIDEGDMTLENVEKTKLSHDWKDQRNTLAFEINNRDWLSCTINSKDRSVQWFIFTPSDNYLQKIKTSKHDKLIIRQDKTLNLGKITNKSIEYVRQLADEYYMSFRDINAKIAYNNIFSK